jgi:hypothetical protein
MRKHLVVFWMQPVKHMVKFRFFNQSINQSIIQIIEILTACSYILTSLDVASEAYGEFSVRPCRSFDVLDVAKKAYGKRHRYTQASFGVLT